MKPESCVHFIAGRRLAIPSDFQNKLINFAALEQPIKHSSQQLLGCFAAVNSQTL